MPNQSQGPLMIVATEALSAPKVRVGHIGGNFTLPRTVPLTSLIAAAIGALLGLAVSLIIVPGLTPHVILCGFRRSSWCSCGNSFSPKGRVDVALAGTAAKGATPAHKTRGRGCSNSSRNSAYKNSHHW